MKLGLIIGGGLFLGLVGFAAGFLYVYWKLRDSFWS